MTFCDKAFVKSSLEGKTVALVGGGPSALENEPGLIDSYDVVVRVNNYKAIAGAGTRTDVFYSYFGKVIAKTPAELLADGVKLCIAKCPDALLMESKWHRTHGKMNGIDFRLIYEARKDWWFCPTYVPTLEEFLQRFNMLWMHIPTTGFSALLDVLQFNPKEVYMTGFDFFESRVHNGNERWRLVNRTDPIGHRPGLEKEWLVKNLPELPVTVDRTLRKSLRKYRP